MDRPRRPDVSRSRSTRRRGSMNGRALRPKTIQLYRYLLRAHLQDAFGSATVAGITEADVRRWRADMLVCGRNAGHRRQGLPAAQGHHGHGGR